MKTYKWFFLVIVSGVLVACPGTSEEELIGDWQRRGMFEGRERAYTANFVIGDKGYACCGHIGVSQRRNETYVFDHREGDGSWDRLADFPGPRRSQAVGFSANGLGYVGTGWDGNETDFKDFWRYDPYNDVWNEVAPMPEVALPRRGAIAFSLLVGGKEYGYVGFGFHEGIKTDERGHLSDIWQFDPEGKTITEIETEIEIEEEDGSWTTEIVTETKELPGSWTKVTGYSGFKREGAAVFVVENRAYICNGKNPANVNDFWMFDPDGAREGKSLWTKKRPMYDSDPNEDYDDDYGGLARSYGVAYVVEVNGQLRGHIVGGSRTNWEYDHDRDLWIQRTNFYNYMRGEAREGMVSFSFPNSGRAFVGMGRSGTAYFDDMWEFIPMVDDYIYDDY